MQACNTAVVMLAASVVDPYHFDTDPDPGSEKIRSGSRPNLDTDPETGKNNADPDAGNQGSSTRKIFKIWY